MLCSKKSEGRSATLPSALFLFEECVIFHHLSSRVSSHGMICTVVYNPSNFEAMFKIICNGIENNIRILKYRY